MSKAEHTIVAIGSSAGGHEALQKFFSAIPSDVHAAFIIVTHLFRTHKSELTRIVSRFTPLRVVRITDLMEVQPGIVYVMPEDVELSIKNGILRLRPRPAEHIINKTIDLFFDSLATDQHSRAMGIVLSGMGSDGTHGAVKIFQKGGDVLVQEPSSTPFNGMPWSAIMQDHPDYILPPAELGQKVTEIIRAKDLKVAS